MSSENGGHGLIHELTEARLVVEAEKALPVEYDGVRVDLLINFNVAHLRQGIRRRILGFGP